MNHAHEWMDSVADFAASGKLQAWELEQSIEDKKAPPPAECCTELGFEDQSQSADMDALKVVLAWMVAPVLFVLGLYILAAVLDGGFA